MLMMRPHLARRMAGSTARAHSICPVTLTRSTCSHSSSGICSNGRISRVEKIPALLISTSMRPYWSSTISTISSIEAGSAMSVVTASAWPSALRISPATAAAVFSLRSAITTLAPAMAKALAKTRPMPCPAPVMMTTRSLNEGNTIDCNSGFVVMRCLVGSAVGAGSGPPCRGRGDLVKDRNRIAHKPPFPAIFASGTACDRAACGPFTREPGTLGSRFKWAGTALREEDMRKALLAASTALMLAAGPAMMPASAQQKSIKIGFVSTFSGPAAVIGNNMRDSFELALDHMGRKMGGLPVEVIYEDDGFKPDVGKQKTDKLIESDHVDFIAGYIWSNVLLASLKPIVDSKTFLVITNAGPSQIAGERCSPTVFSTSWNNDQTPQAMGHYMNQKGVKSVFLIGPNYAAGKDMLAGVAATFKGKIVGEELTTWPAQLDFSAELAKAKAAKPDAVFVFYPGKAGVQFLAQYAQAGLKGVVPLYTAFTIDELSLPLQKDLALGVPGAQEWVNDLPNEANKKFVADFEKKYPC